MHTLITILLILAALIAILLIIALFTRKKYYVQREIIINAPRQKVFDYVKMLRNHDNFNKWAMGDPDVTRKFNGNDGTVGFSYSWNGNKKVGEGEKVITGIVEGKRMEWEMRFVRPFTLTGYSSYTTDEVSENQTHVTLSNSSTLKYPLNIMVLMVEKSLPKDMDESLNDLKNILEK